jgi:hypothetical protein
VTVTLPAAVHGARMDVVDGVTGENPPSRTHITGNQITLAPFAVAVVGLD